MEILKNTEGIQSVVFKINNQLFSIMIDEVVEIIRVPDITYIPRIDSIIEGVINVRGNIIPVISLHKRFNQALPEKQKKNRIVIVQGIEEHIGIIVDEVSMVSNFNGENIEPPYNQTITEDIFIGFAKLEGNIIGILDIEKVLYKKVF